MAEHSHIEWTHATWNPWYGCHKVSGGCKFCYMYREMRQYGRDPNTVQRSRTKFEDPLKWQRALAIGKPAPRIVFTCSWSDFFIEEADQWRAEAWDIIARCPDIFFLILTKRPERIFQTLPARWRSPSYEPLPNVGLGVSVESQQHAGRIRELLSTKAVLHFISVEPMLGPLSLNELVLGDFEIDNKTDGSPLISALLSSALEEFETPTYLRPSLDWVICGGESGGLDARPSDPRWFRAVRDQCAAAGVPFFFKQWGEWGPLPEDSQQWVLRKDGHASIGYFDEHGRFNPKSMGGSPAEAWGHAGVNRMGRERTGRLLDGREWNEMPKQLLAFSGEHTPVVSRLNDTCTREGRIC